MLTSLLDPKRYPAAEIVALHHERWEIELGDNEVKRTMLAREETTRSKSPRGVAQELRGIALPYSLVRFEAERVAAQAGVLPFRISFAAALNFIEMAFACGAPSLLASGPSGSPFFARTSVTSSFPSVALGAIPVL